MGDLRVRHSIAYGRQNNFYTSNFSGGTSGLFGQANTAPDVTLGTLFYTNNSAATTINSFTLSHPAQGQGNLAGYWEGKEIKIVFLDSNTTVAGSRIVLAGTDNAFAQNSFLELVYHTSSWYETSRTQNYSTFVPVALGNSAGLNANFVSSFMMTYVSTGGVSGTAVVQSVSGGMIGQRLLLINNQSSGSIAISTAGNISYSTVLPTIAGSGIYTLAASGGLAEIIKVSNSQWSFVGR